MASEFGSSNAEYVLEYVLDGYFPVYNRLYVWKCLWERVISTETNIFNVLLPMLYIQIINVMFGCV